MDFLFWGYCRYPSSAYCKRDVPQMFFKKMHCRRSITKFVLASSNWAFAWISDVWYWFWGRHAEICTRSITYSYANTLDSKSQRTVQLQNGTWLLFFFVTYPVNVDGESGIQANDVSCNITVARRVVEAPQSSSATGKGSNQVPTPYGKPGSRAFDPSWKANQLDAVRGIYPHDNDMQRDAEDFAQSTEFQGENQPALPEVKSHGEGTCLCAMICFTIYTIQNIQASNWSHPVIKQHFCSDSGNMMFILSCLDTVTEDISLWNLENLLPDKYSFFRDDDMWIFQEWWHVKQFVLASLVEEVILDLVLR